MEPKILLIGEVAALMRVANVTIYRWLAERRSGQGTFPLPISRRKAKLRWLASDIEHYIELQSVETPVFVSPAKREKDYQRRQKAAKAALARHGILVPSKIR
jgi:predicted DNA-binding transcriptional regulator AlpA